MNHFDYRNGVLHAEAVNLIELAEAVGTPFYCYSTATLERHYRVFIEAFAGEKVLVCYAMKANSNQSVLRTLAKLGAGADVVSGGELKRALAAGIPPERILFSGVGKTEAELRAALAADILCINIESEPELELLSRLAGETGKTARISVRDQSRRRCRHPCQDFNRQIREQVRRAAEPRARGLCPRREAARHQGHRRRRAYRQPDHRSGAAGNRLFGFSPISCRRCAPTAMPSRISISAAGSAFPITPTGKRRRCHPPMPRWSSA